MISKEELAAAKKKWKDWPEVRAYLVTIEKLQTKVDVQKNEIRFLKKDNADTIKAILEGSFEM